MKKKIGCIGITIIILSILTYVIFQNRVRALTYTDNTTGLTWTYTVSGDKAINVYVSGGTPGSTLTIPSTLGNYTVTSIRGNTTKAGTSALNILNSRSANTTIKEVIIPTTVTSIGYNTFSIFRGLEKITIPDTVTIVDSYAFYNCLEATEIQMGTGVRTIGVAAFYGCSNAEGILNIPNITSIGNNAFYNMSKVTSVKIGSNLTSLPANVFSSMSGLQNIEVNENNNYYASIDGVLFNKAKTTLIKYPIGKSLESYTIPEGVTTIDSYAFQNTGKLKGKITFPETLSSIGTYAFSYSGISGELILPDSVQTINSSAFYNCKNIESVKFGNGLKTIGSSAFYNNSSLKGDINIPNSVTSLGSYAFQGCSSIDGNIIIGDGIKTISNYTFSGIINAKKTIVGSGVTSISSYAFENFSDIWVSNIPANVSVNERFGGDTKNTYIHWLDDTHSVTISTVPGIKLINIATNEAVTSGDYLCETEFEYKIIIEDGYNYSNLQLVEINNDDTENCTILAVDTSKTYNFSSLLRNRKIYIQNMSKEVDLTLRTFITEINRISVSTSRYPIAKMENGEFNYLHTKYPVSVKKDNLITYRIRIYNEGMKDGNVGKISVYIPEGLAFEPENRTNIVNEWKDEGNGKISTTNIASKTIKGYTGNGMLSYEDIEIALKVEQPKVENENIRLNIIAQREQSDEDEDSTPGNIIERLSSDYKESESYESNSESFIKGQEDDDDFENVLIVGKIKVDYSIKINKIDTDTDELLKGAEFNLLNENEEIIATAVTDEKGVLDFGTLTTYGDGEDIYYVEESSTPEGYISVEQRKIKITVVKTILDENQGTYSVNVICELLDYNVDTTRYEFTPIKTAEHLQKIGSGEKIIIDGVEYEYNTNTNYKLMNDIDLSGINWTPISEEMKCILDGNNYKISNLTISFNSNVEIGEIGLFSYFSGIIQNLELENVNIKLNNFKEDIITPSGYTGIGALAGVMKEGYIINCKVSGNIIASEDNIGGFIGHTAEKGIVKVQNCTNNASITAYATRITTSTGASKQVGGSNVGGLIGCALGAISITDSTNEGKILCTNYNAGGLVGYVKASEYTEVDVTADFDETEKVIDLVVENKNIKGEYSLILENIDGKTLGLIPGAVYRILDKNKNPISNLENVTLQNGSLKLTTVDIDSLGIDTYYIQEITPAEGYEKLTTYIRLDIRRYWDENIADYRVSIDTKNLTDDELTQDKPTMSEDIVPSKTGEIFTKVNIANVSWNSNKAEFKYCINKGEITANIMNSAGIVGTSHCITNISNSENIGKIISVGKAGGIISELKTEDSNKYSRLNVCKNVGAITSGNSQNEYATGSAGGIISHAVGCVKIDECINEAKINSHGGQAAAGIVGDIVGELIIDSCKNIGEVVANSSNASSPNVNCIAGGIVGKGSYDKYTYKNITKDNVILKINNCKNYGNIKASCHLGGIVGISWASVAEITNCEVKNVNINDTSAGDKGGIIGSSSNTNITIENCNIENVKLERTSSIHNTYGGTSGIIGAACKYSDYSGNQMIENINVRNCSVINCTMQTIDKEAAGVIGCQYGVSGTTVNNIFDCKVKGCTILNQNATSSYSSSGGIFGGSYSAGKLNIGNCIVEDTSISSQFDTSRSGYDMNVGGIVGVAYESDSVIIDNCDVKNSKVICNAYPGDSCANAAGIVAVTGESYYGTGIYKVTNCNVIETDISTTAGNAAGVWAIGYKFDQNKLYEISDTIVDNCNVISTSNSSSCSNTAGITAMMAVSSKIDGCEVRNSNIVGDGRNTAGVIGMAYYDTQISNTSVKSTKITATAINSSSYSRSCDCIAGIVGVVGGAMKFTNLIVDDCEITGEQSANVSGIVGCNYSSKAQTMKNCTVSNSDIISNSKMPENGYSVNFTVSGLAGRTGTITVEKCNIINNNIQGKGLIATGGIASANELISKDCIVKGTIIKLEDEKPVINQNCLRAMSGFAGSITNSTQFDNIDIDNVTVQGLAESAAGIYGYVNTLCKMTDCTVNKLTINMSNTMSESNGASAGVGANTGNLVCDMINCNVTNSNITTDAYIAAGMFGYIYSSANLINCNTSNVRITHNNKLQTTYDAAVSGLIGINSNKVQIRDSKVVNAILVAENNISRNVNIGGMIGFAGYDIELNNVKLINNKITNNTSGGITGGVVGLTNYNGAVNPEVKRTLTIKNSFIIDCKEIIGQNHVGGILGFGKLIADTNKITGTTLEGKFSFGDIGGIIGNSLSGTSISGVTADNINISGVYRAGGIVGFSKANIENVNISNSTITASGQAAEAGGIIGLTDTSDSTISNCKADTIDVNAVNGYVGGIAGFANNTLNDCSTINSKITSTGDTANGNGGIVGFGDSGISVNNPTIDSNTQT